jgi:hypothetical protein
MGVIDTLLKASVIVAVAVVSTAVAYHYVIYVPQRDAALDAERLSEAARTNKAQAEQENRVAAEKYQADQLKQLVSIRYENCNRAATANYSVNWDSNCARINQQERANYSDCISKQASTKESCDFLFKVTTKPENCALPKALGDSLNRDLELSKDRCLREFQLGMH